MFCYVVFVKACKWNYSSWKQLPSEWLFFRVYWININLFFSSIFCMILFFQFPHRFSFLYFFTRHHGKVWNLSIILLHHLYLSLYIYMKYIYIYIYIYEIYIYIYMKYIYIYIYIYIYSFIYPHIHISYGHVKQFLFVYLIYLCTPRQILILCILILLLTKDKNLL